MTTSPNPREEAKRRAERDRALQALGTLRVAELALANTPEACGADREIERATTLVVTAMRKVFVRMERKDQKHGR